MIAKTSIAFTALAAITLLHAGNAAAQPRPTATPAATPAPWSAPTPAPALAADASAMTAPLTSEAVTYRPAGRSLGIGAGWTLPADLGTPNTVSARIRMPSGLAIEPIVGVGVGANSGKTGTVKTSSSSVDLFAGAALRKPLMGRNQVDVVGIVTPGLNVSSNSSKDGAGIKTTSTDIGLGASWGLGVELFPRTHWSISFDATNPLINISSGSSKTGTVKSSSTGFFVGTIFDPTIRLMTHIYY